MLEQAFLMAMSFPAEGSVDVSDGPQHGQIVRAMHARCPELAEQTVRRHFQQTQENMLAKLHSTKTSPIDQESRRWRFLLASRSPSSGF
jgi:DNA-binding FadR family transcriptional regulator